MALRPHALIVPCLALLAGGCAVKITPDPRMPGGVDDRPVLLTVCVVEGDTAHLAVGDQVELSNSRLGRLRIRHVPGPENRDGPWNAGESARVRTAMLSERIDPQGNDTNVRRFVPVGRFAVSLPNTQDHVRFDFLASKAVDNLSNDRYPRCNVRLGDDEVLIRGVEDDERHGGLAHLR